MYVRLYSHWLDTLRDSLPGVLHDSLQSDLMWASLLGAPNPDLNAEVETVRQILPQWATTRRNLREISNAN